MKKILLLTSILFLSAFCLTACKSERPADLSESANSSISTTESDEASSEETDTPIPIQCTGISISATGFGDAFSGEPDTRIPIDEAKDSFDPSITIDDIKIVGDLISFTAKLTLSDRKVTLPVTGKLTASFQTQWERNCIIVEIYDKVEGFEFLLFQIYNDPRDNVGNSLLLYDNENYETLLQNSHVQIYLQYEDDTVYLFECEMPEIFANLTATDYPESNGNKDSLWAIHLVK